MSYHGNDGGGSIFIRDSLSCYTSTTDSVKVVKSALLLVLYALHLRLGYSYDTRLSYS